MAEGLCFGTKGFYGWDANYCNNIGCTLKLL